MTIHDDASSEGAAAERLSNDETYEDSETPSDGPAEESRAVSDEDDSDDAPEEELNADDDSEPAGDGEEGKEATAPVDRTKLVRMVEAILFASAEPVAASDLKSRLPGDADLKEILAEIQGIYEPRGVNLVQVAGKWAFRTAGDLGFLLHKERVEQRRLSRAAIETLAIISYHQPVTRAEIEQLRGVTVSKGTLDVLLDIGWVRMRGRRETPGRPLTYGTTDGFLEHFGLATTGDLPGMDDLKAAGLLSWNLPAEFTVPVPPADGEGEGDGDFEEEEPEMSFRQAEAAAMSDEELFEPGADEEVSGPRDDDQADDEYDSEDCDDDDDDDDDEEYDEDDYEDDDDDDDEDDLEEDDSD